MITTQRELRAAFWRVVSPEFHQKRKGWTQNQYPANTRQAWCNYVDVMYNAGYISEALAQRATL